MIKKTLKEISEMVNGSGLDPAYESLVVCGVTINSREVQEGNLFIPIIGARVNGHTFARDAVSQGAVCTFWQQDQGNVPTDIPVIVVANTERALQQLAVAYRRQLNLKVVGITGSNGKTSTKDILASILSTTFNVHKTPGNLNSEFGMPLTLLQAKADTEVAVLEMGMQGLGQIKLLSDLAEPDACIITNIGEAHIELLGSRENISRAKFEIVAGLKKDGIFVYHGDEPLLQAKVANLKAPYQLATFGDDPQNDYYPTSMKIAGTGMVFTIPQVDFEFVLPVLGKHNVMNTLAAIGVAHYFGVSYENMKKGLQALEMTKMRMEIVKTAAGLTVINDAYNASPTSVRATLDLLTSLTGYEKKIVVLADMLELGEQETAYHQEIGAYVDEQQVDALFTYGPLAEQIAATSKVVNTRTFESKQALADAIKEITTARDVVLVKGSRGMALEDIIEALKLP